MKKKKGMLSLTEDGKPGGTFRTFFVWTSRREKRGKQNNAWGFNRPRGFYSHCLKKKKKKRASLLICLDLTDRPRRKSKATFPTTVDTSTKGAFTANKRGTVRCRKSKDGTQRGPAWFFPQCFNKSMEGSFVHVHIISQGFSQGERSINWEGETLMEKWKRHIGVACVCVLSRQTQPRLHLGHYCPAFWKGFPVFFYFFLKAPLKKTKKNKQKHMNTHSQCSAF